MVMTDSIDKSNPNDGQAVSADLFSVMSECKQGALIEDGGANLAPQNRRQASTHQPVLLAEVIAGLDVRPGGAYIDATIGLAGHAMAILETSAPTGRLLGIDADPFAIDYSRQRLQSYRERSATVQGNFGELDRIAREQGFTMVDGILLDLGVSSHQLSSSGRGFSFQYDAPLDMRMDPSLKQTAAQLVNQLDEAELTSILRQYGEEPHARRVANAIIRRRPLHTTQQLASLVYHEIGRPGLRIHPATRTFQALRIAVNQELDNLKLGLAAALNCLRPQGRLAVVSFHSLEDRIVKNFLREESRDCVCPPGLPVCVCAHRAHLRLLHPGGTTPSATELAANRRSRSARLRVAERI